MNVFLLGADGFIGRQIACGLRAGGLVDLAARLVAARHGCWRPVCFTFWPSSAGFPSSLCKSAFAAHHLYRVWFALGWPAFLGLVAAFWLMVAKPSFGA